MRAHIFTILPLLAVAACAGDPEFGHAVSYNVAAQAVDMNPQYAGLPIEGAHGGRAADAYSRYKKGQVKALNKVVGDTKIGSQGGAGDSSTQQ